VLKQCIRIALEDGSISGFDPSGKIVASIEKKIGKEAATPSPLMQAAGKADETADDDTHDELAEENDNEDMLQAMAEPTKEETVAGKAAPQASAESAEPVAYRHKHFQNDPWQYRENKTFGTLYPYYEPLYLEPQPSRIDAAAEPTREEIEAAAKIVYDAMPSYFDDGEIIQSQAGWDGWPTETQPTA
jgi:hypothetical protein